MLRNFPTGLLLSALACAASAIPVARAISAPPADRLAPAMLQSRLERLAPASASPARARAQCWIDLARQEGQQSAIHANRTPDKALRNADALIGALEQGRDNAPAEPIFVERLYPSTNPRDGRPAWFADIRQIEGALAAYRDRQCETPLSACLDVAYQSVMENMEESRGGRWNHGRMEIDRALALASRSSEDLATCESPPAGTPFAEPGPIAPGGSKPRVAITQNLDADALFGFDSADLTHAGREALDRFVTALEQRSDVARIRVVGHTDRFGSDAYNLALSRRRAQAVRQYLVARAVPIPIAASGAGAAGARVDCPGPADARTLACLQPNRRVELTAESSTGPATDPPTDIPDAVGPLSSGLSDHGATVQGGSDTFRVDSPDDAVGGARP